MVARDKPVNAVAAPVARLPAVCVARPALSISRLAVLAAASRL